jgi:hypothetical protein
MKKTSQIIVMAALCLNFAYGQDTQKCVNTKKNNTINYQGSLPYKYDFSGFKSGYPCGYRISNDDFMKGKSITVRNYTITQLFALAMGAGDKSCPAIPADHIFLEVREPKQLEEIKCFQLVVPFYLADNFYTIMQQCLNAEFPEYAVSLQSRGRESVMVIKDKEY